ncbi:hypothetical protein [Colwellia echini]|uniref:Uncharacterized protein n=1 Tax=Colwellia echini TaxID=1982103 RepID=A0ABY3MZ96_9GAMM|nr:hypothetical protein [Colwellia echini]TYK66529.1 hypothetical protein CWS31_004095 [Colwellia echini]
MNILLSLTVINLWAIALITQANASEADVYINQNIGFNVEGYNYNQPALPCDIDKSLVELIIKKSKQQNIEIEAVTTTEKIHNGKIPVVSIDIEQLVLSKDHIYGKITDFNLPKLQITAGIIKGEDIQTAKHTCAVASTSSEHIKPTDVVKYNQPGVSICGEAQKCLEDLSKDVVQWLKPQL